MTDLLETPVGDFEWGPDRRSHRARDWIATTWLRRVFPQLALGLGAALLAIGVGLLWTTSPSQAVPVNVSSPDQAPAIVATENAAPETTPSETLAPRLVVHVSGQVAAPGIVELATPARIFQAIEAAGGALPTADLTQLNLAAPVNDGSRLHVPTPAETSALGLTRPDTGEPDTGAPDTEAGEPDTGEPYTEAAKPDKREPDTGEPDMDAPDAVAAEPDAGEPETSELGAGAPDAVAAEPDAGEPETRELDVERGAPDTTEPGQIEPAPTPHPSGEDPGP